MHSVVLFWPFLWLSYQSMNYHWKIKKNNTILKIGLSRNRETGTYFNRTELGEVIDAESGMACGEGDGEVGWD